MAASRPDLSGTPISCSSAIATSQMCCVDRGPSAPRSSVPPMSGPQINLAKESAGGGGGPSGGRPKISGAPVRVASHPLGLFLIQCEGLEPFALWNL
jgi:hypothetical protein